MTKTKTYTIDELARLTKIPPTTARYYIENYKEFFDFTRPNGAKYRVFEESCIDVLKEIRKAQKSGLKKHEIIKNLAQKFTPIYEEEPDTPTKEQTNNQQATISNKTSMVSINSTTQKQLTINTREHIETLVDFNSQQIELTRRYQGQSKHKSAIIQEQDKKIENLIAKIKELNETIKEGDENIGELKLEVEKLKKKKGRWF